MPYRVTFLEDAGVIETEYTGRMTRDEFEAAVAATVDAVLERDRHRLLSDCTGLDVAASPLDLWSLAEWIAAQPPGMLEREAVVLPPAPETAAEVAFYETACKNRGINVRVFSSRDEALAWLSA
jgi:hypothetical protein